MKEVEKKVIELCNRYKIKAFKMEVFKSNYRKFNFAGVNRDLLALKIYELL